MTEIHMRAAGLPLHEMLGAALSTRERNFRTVTREALEANGLTVLQVFSKSAVPQTIPEILPDGTRENTSYVLLTIGIDIDAPAEAIEQALADLAIPDFPAAAWKFPED